MADWDAARSYLKGQRQALALKSFDELAGLDEFATTQTPEHLRPFQFTTCRNVLPDGSLRIFVQAWRSHFFGMWCNSVADGFVISPTGTQRELSRDELLD